MAAPDWISRNLQSHHLRPCHARSPLQAGILVVFRSPRKSCSVPSCLTELHSDRVEAQLLGKTSTKWRLSTTFFGYRSSRMVAAYQDLKLEVFWSRFLPDAYGHETSPWTLRSFSCLFNSCGLIAIRWIRICNSLLQLIQSYHARGQRIGPMFWKIMLPSF